MDEEQEKANTIKTKVFPVVALSHLFIITLLPNLLGYDCLVGIFQSTQNRHSPRRQSDFALHQSKMTDTCFGIPVIKK